MRYVVCLFGVCRGDEKCWESLVKNVINPLKADVVIHSWISVANQNTHMKTYQPGVENISKLLNFLSDSSVNLVSSKFDKQNIVYPETIELPWGKVYFSNQINMYRSILDSANLAIKSGGNYDYFIFARMDLLFMNEFSENNFNQNKGISHGGIFKQIKNAYDFEDVFFVVSSEHLSLIDIVLKNHQKMKYIDNKVYNILLAASEENGSPVFEMKFKYDIDFNIVRNFKFHKRILQMIKRVFLKFVNY